MFDHKKGALLTQSGNQIYFESTGDETGKAVVFLHGGMQSIASFNPLLNCLPSSGLRYIGIDTRGHGRSTLNGTLTYDDIQTDAEAVLKHLNVDECIIIGHSDGGTAALRMALSGVVKVSKVVCIGSQWNMEADDPALEIYDTLTAEAWQAQFPENVAEYEALNPAPDLNHLISELVSLWTDMSEKGYPGNDIDNLSVPLLIIRGDDDFLMSREHAFALAERVESAVLFNLPFAGHTIHEECPAVTGDIITQFLAV